MKAKIKPENKATPKAEETRARILAAALRLFRERGFDATTMRDIAAAADVAIGAAYYYFESKEALVMAFYEEASRAMQERIEAALGKKSNLEARLRAVIDVKFEYFEPNRRFLGALLGHAADPRHPLSPFSAETLEIRERDMRLFSVALTGSSLKITDDLKPHLPHLFWLYQMSLILFWIHDQSPGCTRTQWLVDRSLGIVVGLLKLSRLPVLRPLRRTVIEFVREVMSDVAASATVGPVRTALESRSR
jgi:AcrR family transcriptional regulator